eukprot:CAMPEP_0113410610 /NCGR_PEP_ID=MMETSP0013_2-20120614/21790_1 /TAXON_ID=2843 ORGANISM="Skeletonema costatum, Strain 1716" /NCGR_SAMPLE_ID=MMETSP0013_2 /ASSEMBLY_ACC=CAM_ASM_000158 /LENGTH=1161 /DNA_ID=CAMNT_0000296841 /DNA_START=434 /DNA_END=3917 /DNA_ORIENTATION=- /assembly_acc=CAM_ASM_000158
MSKGRNVSDFMPHVVKLVGAPSLEVRKMVYIYLARYANHDAQCREMALLSINAFQRGLADREPLLRSLALRVLTCMDVPDVLQLQILGVRTCCKDSSPYVRKCAANAVGKLHPRCLEVGDESQAEQLVDIITTLLEEDGSTMVLEEDGSTMVLTSAMIAFCEICPQRLDLLHGCYRKVCHLLTDMDEWGQVMVIDALMRYCRTYFKQPRGQLKGSAERIDQERRVTRSTRKEIVDGTIVVDNEEPDSINESETNGDTTDALLAMTTLGTTTNDTASPPPALPPRPKQKKVKRRVVRKAFYSDEEDESEEDEVGSLYPITGGNIAAAMRDHSVDASPNPSPLAALAGGKKSFGFRDDVNAQNTSVEDGVLSAAFDLDDDEDTDLDEDHKLLLQSSLPLLRSRNSAVVLTVCSLHYYCGVASIKTRAALGKALVRIHRDRREIQYIVLVSIRTLVQECPSAFTPFLNDFFVKGMDPSFTRMIKLDILVSLCIDPSAIDAVLSELRSYVRHNDKSFACAAIIAVGKVAELARIVYDRRAFTGGIDADAARDESNSIALGCLSGLVTLSEFSKNDQVVGECIATIQRLLAQLWSKDGGFSSGGGEGNIKVLKDPALIQERVLKRLLLILIRSISEQDEEPDEEETNTNRLEDRAVAVPPPATASLLWTIGEWLTMSAQTLTWNMDSASKSKIRVEVLRMLAKAFSQLDAQIKLQALHLASKVFLMNKSDHGSSSAESLSEFILAMGRADVMQDVRDRARYESNVLHLSAGLNGDTSMLQQRPSSNCMSVEKARKMLLDRKPTATSLPLDGKEFGSAKNEIDIFRFGSLSSIVGLKAGGSSLPLPDWALVNSSSSLRDPEVLRQKKAAEDEADLYDDSSSGSSSSDDDTSSSDSSSSSDDSSDESSDSDSEEEEEIVSDIFVESNGSAAKPIPASTQVSNDLLPSMINEEEDESSSSASSSSDDSSDSDIDSSSSSDDSSDESSDSDSEEEEEEELVSDIIVESNGLAAKPIPASTQVSNDLLPSMINEEEDDSSSSASSSSDDSSDSDSEMSDDNLEGETAVQNQPVVEGTLFDLPADTINTTQPSKPQYAKGASTGSSVASGLEGLVMSPLVVNKSDANEPSNIDDDSGLWKPLVRPELSGGLSVKLRFIFGQSRAKEVATLGL